MYTAILIAVFILGVSAGAIIENRRITLLDRINFLEKITQEIFLPLADKIEHIDTQVSSRPSMLVDHERNDPDVTMELPKIQTQERGKHAERKETW